MLATRIAHVAIDANIGHRLGGVDGAVAFTRKHARRGLDPVEHCSDFDSAGMMTQVTQ